MSKDSLYSGELIHINMLQEKTEIWELQFNPDGAHEGDCNNPGEAFTVGYRETHAIGL